MSVRSPEASWKPALYISNFVVILNVITLKVLYFLYCIFRMYIFLYYTVGILWTAKEEFHCISDNMFLYCDNKHTESQIVNYQRSEDFHWKTKKKSCLSSPPVILTSLPSPCCPQVSSNYSQRRRRGIHCSWSPLCSQFLFLCSLAAFSFQRGTSKIQVLSF